MASKDVLLLLSGDIPDQRLLRRVAKNCRFVLCADGGLRRAVALKLRADFVIGDMDSLPHPLPQDSHVTYWCDFDENRGDFEKALDFAAAVGAGRVFVAGVTGGEIDHVLVNLSLFSRYSKAMNLVMVAEGLGRILGPGRHRLDARRGQRFSLLAHERAVVTLTGARYTLGRAPLLCGSRGLGNTSRGAAILTVHQGRVWSFTQVH